MRASKGGNVIFMTEFFSNHWLGEENEKKIAEELEKQAILLRAYDDYFDDCERANKHPLSFDQWREKCGL
jgi:hypothetical protein